MYNVKLSLLVMSDPSKVQSIVKCLCRVQDYFLPLKMSLLHYLKCSLCSPLPITILEQTLKLLRKVINIPFTMDMI